MTRPPLAAFVLGLLSAVLAPAQSTDLDLPDDPFAAVAAMPAQPPVQGGLIVQVLAADGSPATDAVVILMPSSHPDYAALRVAAERRYPGDEPRIIAARATRGTRYRLDGRGTTRVPADLRGRIVAVKGDILASVIRDQAGLADGHRTELQLHPAWSFEVAVRCADGRPAAGVGIALLTAPAAFPFPRTSTGDDGTARFRGIPGRPPATALVQALIASRDPVTCPMPGTDGAAATMQLPPCGSIEATLDGETLPGSTLTWTLSPDGSWQDVGLSATEALDRSATFRFVEAGFVGAVKCRITGSQEVSRRIEALAADATEKVTLTCEPQRALVVRILGPDGSPERDAYLRLRWQYARGSKTASSRTNAEGWAEIEIPDRADESSTLSIIARGASWTSQCTGSAELKLGKTAQTRIDRGELRLQALPLAVAGRLVGSGRNSPSGVRLSISSPSSHESFYGVTDADGSFAITMPKSDDDAVSLSLDGDDWFLDDSPNGQLVFAAGSKDLRIAVHPAGRVLFAGEDFGRDLFPCISLGCVPHDGDGKPVDIRFRFDAKEIRVPPGIWDFVFRCADAEVRRIDNVAVDPGIETHDPRFMFFDWKQFATITTIRVEDANGKPTDACTVWHQYRNGASGRSPTDGVLRMLVPKEGAHVTVESDVDKQPEIDLGMATGDYTVRLGCGPRLRVRLSAAPELPAGVELTVAAVGSDKAQAFDGEHTADLWLPRADTWKLAFSVRKGEISRPVDFERSAVDVEPRGLLLTMPLTADLQARIDRAARDLQ
ncbi:MAG: hypothetical protein KDC98_09140 [Planctomycetes bacterium]|nr:hypothetical protein [Planctomycetota bacterium]